MRPLPPELPLLGLDPPPFRVLASATQFANLVVLAPILVTLSAKGIALAPRSRAQAGSFELAFGSFEIK